jgi:hypothetical protein
MAIPNRWWVGQNVGETGGQSTVFGGPSTFGQIKPNGYQSLPSGNKADDAAFATAAKKNTAGGPGTPVTINVENVLWFNIRGPFTTQAQANAAIPSIQAGSPANGAVAQASGNTGLPDPTGAITSVNDFLSRLTSPNTWLRVEEFTLGALLVLAGALHLAGVDPMNVAKLAPPVRFASKILK